ncbi:hypothetical protein WKI68_41800 [Streptomyces sp. MS1.HAVA.3]|uniref:Uncharacterized protein n=1 Tax=Streptomyces caledonius TaxID=3134107 RepID=A0ABU8UDM3_9ACTN
MTRWSDLTDRDHHDHPGGRRWDGRVLGERRAGRLELCRHAAPLYVAGARLVERGARLRAGDPVPFLLSVPSRPTGAVEPHELVARLAEYGRLGVRPGPADLGQALLRCGGPIDPEVVRVAKKSELEEGPGWLPGCGRAVCPDRRGGGSASPVSPSVPAGAGEQGQAAGPWWVTRRSRAAVRPRRFWSLFRKFEPHIGCPHASLPDGRDAHTVATLPRHPEIAAARC